MSLTNINLSAGPGQPSVGTILSVATPGSPLTYKPIGNIGDIKWNLKRKTADVSNQGTPFTQTIGTIFDGGTVTGKIHFIPGSAGNDSSGAFGHGFATGLGYVFTLFPNSTVYWQITTPLGQVVYFQGFISDFPLDFAVEKDITADITITVTGEPIFTTL